MIKRIKDQLNSSDIVLAFTGSKISMEEVDALRRSLPPTSRAAMVKNTLFKIAAQNNSKFSMLCDHVKEQNMFLFIPEDDVSITLDAFSKWRAEFEKEKVVKLGIYDEALYLSDNIDQLFALRSRPELMARLVAALKRVPMKLVGVLRALHDKRLADGDAAFPTASPVTSTTAGSDFVPASTEASSTPSEVDAGIAVVPSATPPASADRGPAVPTNTTTAQSADAYGSVIAELNRTGADPSMTLGDVAAAIGKEPESGG
jgi:ribosomal protein L10